MVTTNCVFIGRRGQGEKYDVKSPPYTLIAKGLDKYMLCLYYL